MGCNCKKNVVKSEQVLTDAKRRDYPDTPQGELAYELDKFGKQLTEEIKDDTDYFNNVDDYHFKTPNS